jgi:5-methylcytosine-specific restriction enzyme subunit McrC
MKYFVFFEHDGFLHQSSISTAISDLDLSDHELKMLQAIKHPNHSNKPIFKFTQNTIKATSVVGVISLGKVTIEILPKLLTNTNTNSKTHSQLKSEILKNLMYMLSYTHFIEVSDGNLSELSHSENSFIEAYIKIFATRLEKHLQQKGPPKLYIEETSSINTIRGKVQFSETLRKNSYDISRLVCAYDSFSENNKVSQGLKFVALNLLALTQDNQTALKLKRSLTLLENSNAEYVTPSEFMRSAAIKKDPNLLSLLNLTLFFLKKLRPEFTGVRKNQIISILFDMNELFESFVLNALKRNAQALGITSVLAQEKKRLVEAERDLSGELEWQKRYLFDTKTDISLTKADGTRVIIDTKYKLLDRNQSHYNIDNQDVYQILAYQKIHYTGEQPPKLILLYPKNVEHIRKEFKVFESESTFIAWTLDLSQDFSKNHELLISELKLLIESRALGPCRL